MTLGPGKYDALCTLVREQSQGLAVAIIVVHGKLGSGFALQGLPDVITVLPGALRLLADEIEADVK